MKGQAQRVSADKRKIKVSSAQKRKSPPKFVDKFANDIPGKNYIHDLSDPAERKRKTGIGFELKGDRGFLPYKKMNKQTGQVELVVFESVQIAKICIKSFEEKGVETKLALFVEGAKLCDFSKSYTDENKVIRAFSSNLGHHVFYQDLSWKMMSAGYVKLISSKMIAKEDMNNFNLDGFDVLKAFVFDLAANRTIKRIVHSEDDLVIFEINKPGCIVRGMLMSNRTLISMNSKRRAAGLRAFTFDSNSSKNTDYYLAFYTLPIKWYADQMQEAVNEVIEEFSKFETELIGSRCKTTYYSIELRNGIIFKEEEVKGDV